MHDGMPWVGQDDPIQGQGQGHECLKVTQEESTVSPARKFLFIHNRHSPHFIWREECIYIGLTTGTLIKI